MIHFSLLSRTSFAFKPALLATGLLLATSCLSAPAQAQDTDVTSVPARSPSLVVTSGPIPKDLQQSVYTKPVQVREITAQEVMAKGYDSMSRTVVSDRVAEFNSELNRIQGRATSLAMELETLERDSENRTADYYANIATISTQLQSGTTPGNPRLVERLSEAEQHLEDLSITVTDFNSLAIQISETASEASFLLEESRAAYGISGAIEDDHIRLAEIEDSIHGTLILIERMLNTVNDDITRTSTYLATERQNLRTLAMGVTNGDLYGKSLANRPFSNASGFQQASAPASASMDSGMSQSASVPGQRILAKVKFDKPDVNYEQPLYLAMTQALERYPNARFDLVAVNPTSGNAAEVAIETTRARRNAEKVLRSLNQMGLPMDLVDLSYSESASATSSEVHLFIK